MKYIIKNLIPHPMQESSFVENSVWKSEFEIDCTQNYLLKAQSGKGKSSFISFLYGARFDYNGSILLKNKNLKEITLKGWSEFRQTKLSIVLQDLQLFNELSLLDNLLVKNELTKFKTIQEIKELINQFGLGGKEKQICNTLSLGQQQRVAIIRALLQPFSFLLMDEPFSHLDELNASIALDIIKTECTQNKAGFLISSLGSEHKLSDINLLQV
jgi:ABC-type lipoprotein export system ATPase subunit